MPFSFYHQAPSDACKAPEITRLVLNYGHEKGSEENTEELNNF